MGEVPLQVQQGIKNLTDAEAEAIIGKDRESHQRDLYESIENGDFPKWTLKSRSCRKPTQPSALPSVRPHQGLATQGLPADRSRCDGTQPQPGKLLRRGRAVGIQSGQRGAGHQLLAGQDATGSPVRLWRCAKVSSWGEPRHIPVNAPKCPFHSYHRDGAMRTDGNFGGTLGYEPNSDGEWQEQPDFKEPPLGSMVRPTLMLGTSEQPKVQGEGQIVPVNAHGLKVISVGFLNPGDKPLIWRGPMLHSIIRQFIGSVDWGQLDYLIIDLPPGTGDVALSLIQTVPLTGSIVVSTPSDVALQDARKAIEMFRQMKVDIVGIVENMSYFICPHCQHEVDIFSKGGAEKMAKQFDAAFLGSVELDPEIGHAGDNGSPAVLKGEDSAHAKSLFAFARRVVARVEEIKSSASENVIQIQ